ncbi:MAG: hydrogenase maturation nickel metallochaperone HypA [Deltaproteobacteria bacterium]|nr:hydrogenase maturation nickel metallochaperone HypA [Deltaproteobacteria bacterium]
MHELSLAQSLLRQLHDLAAQNGAKRVSKVTVEIGPLAGIVRDSFEFGFTTLAAESPVTHGAALVIKTSAPEYQCLDCNHMMPASLHRPLNCPACQSEMVIPNGGSDIVLLQVEMETADGS